MPTGDLRRASRGRPVRPAAPEGYMHADAAAQLLGVKPASISAIARRDGWRRKAAGGRGFAWIYVVDDVRSTERKRRG